MRGQALELMADMAPPTRPAPRRFTNLTVTCTCGSSLTTASDFATVEAITRAWYEHHVSDSGDPRCRTAVRNGWDKPAEDGDA